ncbi:hypothetical protein BA177_17405 [Woeseia oceani]|uniref:Uncharacterized protein n=1 Tax=Woeseia oceani TaxID=1548547 RepID=A0A193LJU6_9GAMM|nr:hypothetical protein BA177_17405 [Woeseia oceani]
MYIVNRIKKQEYCIQKFIDRHIIMNQVTYGMQLCKPIDVALIKERAKLSERMPDMIKHVRGRRLDGCIAHQRQMFGSCKTLFEPEFGIAQYECRVLNTYPIQRDNVLSQRRSFMLYTGFRRIFIGCYWTSGNSQQPAVTLLFPVSLQARLRRGGDAWAATAVVSGGNKGCDQQYYETDVYASQHDSFHCAISHPTTR